MTTLYQIHQVTSRPLGNGPEAPVHVAQIQFEFESALGLYLAREPKRVLEIGTYCGGTLYHWLQNAVAGAVVVTVDSLVAAPDNRALFPAWTPPDVTCVPVIGDSHAETTVAEVFRYHPFDWVFIDALHTYDAAKRDWEIYSRMCAPGAVVLFHDIRLVREYPEDGTVAGVSRLWRELQAQGFVTQELVGDPSQTEYGIGAVYL